MADATTAWPDRHPSVAHFEPLFAHAHLPAHLAEVSGPFADLAEPGECPERDDDLDNEPRPAAQPPTPGPAGSDQWDFTWPEGYRGVVRAADVGVFEEKRLG